MYLIVLEEGGRIRAARDRRPGEQIPEGRIAVEALPAGELRDYLYRDGAYVYEPLPKSASEEPALTLEERVGDLETALCELLESLA